MHHHHQQLPLPHFQLMCICVHVIGPSKFKQYTCFQRLFCKFTLKLKLTLSQRVCICVHVRGFSEFSTSISFPTCLFKFALELKFMSSQRVCNCVIFRVPPQIAKTHMFPKLFLQIHKLMLSRVEEALLRPKVNSVDFWFWLQPQAKWPPPGSFCVWLQPEAQIDQIDLRPLERFLNKAQNQLRTCKNTVEMCMFLRFVGRLWKWHKCRHADSTWIEASIQMYTKT